MADAIVIGAGLFGQIITKALRAQGRDVVMVDASHAMYGSGPAACLMKPSWFSSLGKEVYEPSLGLLDELYGVQDIEFVTRPKLAKVNVHWIPPEKILEPRAISDKVVSIDEDNIVMASHGGWQAPLIVVAAGIWTEKLLPQYKQTGQQGIAFMWPKATIREPFIQPWAPYRQLVAFNRGDGLWASDGTAIKMENWSDSRAFQSRARVSMAVETAMGAPIETSEPWPLMGIRPYAKGHKPCLLEEVRPGLWVASGGAKNGTLAAGYCAHVIMERTS